MWVAVAVVGTDADQGGRGCDRCQERRVGGRRAVVGHGEQLGGQLVGALLEQLTLGRLLEVSGEQDPPVGPAHAQRHRGVVETLLGVGVEESRRGMEHLESEVAHGHDIAGSRRARRHVGGVGRGQRVGHGLRGLGWRADPERVDLRAGEHRLGSAGVVEVAVGEHQRVEAGSAVVGEPSRRAIVGAGIDQDPRLGRFEQERVPLADIDRGDGQLGDGHEPPDHRRRGHDGQQREQREPGNPCRPAPRRRHEPPAGREGGQHHHGTLGGDHRSAPGPGVGDGQYPRGGQARGQRQQRRRGDVDLREQRRGVGQRGGERGQRYGQQVRGDRHQGQLTEPEHEQRRDRQLGPDRDREQVGDPPWQPVQTWTHPGRDHQHPRGRRGREQQTQRARQGRIDQQQAQQRRGQRLAWVARNPPGGGDQVRGDHRGGPQHARLEAGDHREPGHRQADRETPATWSGPRGAGREQRPAGHDRDVGA